MVINLDSRKDRWQHMQSQFSRLRLPAPKRFSACRLASLDDAPPAMVDRLQAFFAEVSRNGVKASEVLGTIGCLQSHVAVIAQAAAEKWPYVLVIEDDCQFEPYTVPVLRRAVAELERQPWDMVFFGGGIKRGGKKQKVSSHLLNVSRVRLAHCYLVHERIYPLILAEARDAGLPIDWYYSEVLTQKVTALMVNPVVAYQGQIGNSDIAAVLRKRKFKSRLFLRRLYCRLRYLLG